MRKFFFVLLVWHLLPARAQVITVIDKTTRQELPSVLVYAANTKKSVFTNAKGQADVSAFAGADSLVFKLVGIYACHHFF
jgi:hemoglobin/transferrin/lactoferrin receptor protein